MNTERETLRQIGELHHPRDLIILPKWVDSKALDRLIAEGYLTFTRLQRSQGIINLVMGLEVTKKGAKWLQSPFDWEQLAIKGSISGICLTLFSVALLYLA